MKGLGHAHLGRRGRWRRGGGGQPLVQGLAHLLDGVVQAADLFRQDLRALEGLGGHGLGEARHPLVHLLQLVGQDHMRIAHVGPLATVAPAIQHARDLAMQGCGQGQAADQGRDARAPAAAVPPDQQRHSQGQTEIGAGQKRHGDFAHRFACSNHFIIERVAPLSRIAWRRRGKVAGAKTKAPPNCAPKSGRSEGCNHSAGRGSEANQIREAFLTRP